MLVLGTVTFKNTRSQALETIEHCPSPNHKPLKTSLKVKLCTALFQMTFDFVIKIKPLVNRDFSNEMLFVCSVE